MKKLIIGGVLLLLNTLMVMAQSGTNSPYSQYGLGVLSDQSQGFNRGMAGLALGLRSGSQVNMQNPASYSSVDSLTMLLDVGLSAQLTNFKEGNASVNAKNANFEYAVAAFRVMPKMGVSFGVVPFTNIGYSYSESKSMYGYVPSYTGSGGLHQAYVGVGYELFKGLSVGANFSYLWGSYEKSVTTGSNVTTTTASTVTKTYGATVNSYRIDLGAQYQQQLTKRNLLTVGATFGLGHKLGADPYVITTNSNSTTNVGDTITNGLSIPMMLGVGAALVRDHSLTVGLDYRFQHWGTVDYPHLNANNQYVLQSGLLKDRHQLTLGADWVPSAMSRRFFNRVHYRAGISYATPYYNINGQDGPKEVSLTAGFGIPIINSWNNRSVLNVSVQWAHQSANHLITENSFRVNIGLTFNERWFAKWKVD